MVISYLEFLSSYEESGLNEVKFVTFKVYIFALGFRLTLFGLLLEFELLYTKN